MTIDPGGESSATPPDSTLAFREFLYADIARVRSLFAQLEGGIPEQDTATNTKRGRFNIGVRNYLGYNRERGSEEYQQRSLLDALFPDLEAILEADGWLTDISSIVDDETSTNTAALTSVVGPGSIIRLTTSGQLFDTEYIARTIGGTSVASDAVMKLASADGPQPATGSKKHTDRKRNIPSPGYSTTGRLEDLVEDFDPGLLGVTPDYLRYMVRTVRGMFASGLHLQLSTSGAAGWAATARLQKGRQYLDAEPDVLFSRYGTAPQEWTVVGTIGHFSTRSDSGELDAVNFMNDDGTVSRPAFVQGFNALISFLANQGFADTPPFPGFSVVPLAVYRLIPEATIF